MLKINHFHALFSLFSIFILVDSKNDCLTTFCGANKSFPIHYPFQLQGDKHQKGCDQNRAVNLKCSSNQDNVPVLNLPSTGELNVRNVNYSAQTVQLYDPNNCLPGLFLNSNLLPFPLMAINYQNYTFFNCPSNETIRSSNYTSIGCLSNSTSSILATSSISRAQEIINLGCNIVRTIPIPVSSSLQYEYNGFNDDLMLKWDVPNCEVCDQSVPKKKVRSAGATAGLILGVLSFPIWGSLIFYLLVTFFLLSVKVYQKFIPFVKRNLNALASRARGLLFRQHQTAPVPSQTRLPVVAALPRRVDLESSALSTIVVGESRRIPGPNSSVCPICLEDYNPRDTIKCSVNCEHYFHASCIDLWLRTHNSCPVCRTTATP